MSDARLLATRFEAERPRLTAVAYRMLGSRAEADDAVQEAWLRLSRADADAIDNLGGWLTTVVARVSLDVLRTRTSRREDPSDVVPEPAQPRATRPEPEDEAVLADSVGAALLVVLDTLSPAERLAFVLHDMFAVPFDEIGPMLGRSAAACKQLASRARHKIRGSEAEADFDPHRQKQVVDAFLAASRHGEFEALVALLDPGIVLRADAAAVEMGAPAELRGADAVAGMFSGRAQGARPASVDGRAGLAWIVAGIPKVVWEFAVVDGKVTAIEMLAAPETLEGLDLEIVGR
jgi:RNA polymerase sigma-70 factor (ECF subfamily)